MSEEHASRGWILASVIARRLGHFQLVLGTFSVLGFLTYIRAYGYYSNVIVSLLWLTTIGLIAADAYRFKDFNFFGRAYLVAPASIVFTFIMAGLCELILYIIFGSAAVLGSFSVYTMSIPCVTVICCHVWGHPHQPATLRERTKNYLIYTLLSCTLASEMSLDRYMPFVVCGLTFISLVGKDIMQAAFGVSPLQAAFMMSGTIAKTSMAIGTICESFTTVHRSAPMRFQIGRGGWISKFFATVVAVIVIAAIAAAYTAPEPVKKDIEGEESEDEETTTDVIVIDAKAPAAPAKVNEALPAAAAADEDADENTALKAPEEGAEEDQLPSWKDARRYGEWGVALHALWGKIYQVYEAEILTPMVASKTLEEEIPNKASEEATNAAVTAQ